MDDRCRDFFPFITASISALGPTQSPIHWVLRTLGVKQLGHEADHPTPLNAEVKTAWSCTSTPTVHLHGVVLSKAQEQLYILPMFYCVRCGKDLSFCEFKLVL